MNIQEKKLERQLLGINKWVHAKDHGLISNGSGTFWWYTAVGKTFAALIVSNRLLNRNSSARIIVIVPSAQLQKQWIGEIAIHVAPEYHHNFEVYTIHYLVENGLNYNCDLLIADELHEYLTPERLKYLDRTKINFKWNLGLTATYQDSQRRQKNLPHYWSPVDIITEREALREGFISKYIEYNLACQLTTQEEIEYKAYSERIAKLLAKLNGSLDLAGKILSGAKGSDGRQYSGFAIATTLAKQRGWIPGGDLDNVEYAAIDAEWNPKMIMGYARNLMEFVRERANILYTAENKKFTVVEIMKKFPYLKTICFSQSTKFADNVAELINKVEPNSCVTYHSKMDTIFEKMVTKKGVEKVGKIGSVRLKRRAIEAIKSGKAMRISTASALDKGFNVEDIRLAIAASGTQNPTQHKQRGGRAKRLDMYAPDETVLIINLYIPDTRDEAWLRKRQKDSTNIIYQITSIDEVTYVPVDPNIINSNLI